MSAGERLKPGDYHPDDAEWVDRLQGKDVRLCGFEQPTGWRCIQPVMRDSDRCYQHSTDRRPLIDRFSDEQLRSAAELVGRGATHKKAAEVLGVTPSQFSRLTQSARFPEIVFHNRPLPEKATPVELVRVGLMKTERGWSELYAGE